MTAQFQGKSLNHNICLLAQPFEVYLENKTENSLQKKFQKLPIFFVQCKFNDLHNLVTALGG